MEKQFQNFSGIIDSNLNFILTTHINPDCDAIGSELALAYYLIALGKKVTIINHDSTPPFASFLDREQMISSYNQEIHDDLIKKANVIIILDANELARIGKLHSTVEISPAIKICIDHHLNPQPFADLYIIDDDSCATGDILYQFFQYIGINEIPQPMAESLYAAIMTDTGSFRFPRTNDRIHLITANLLKYGADPVSIYENIYNRNTIGKLQLLGKMLENIKTAHNDRVAYSFITKQMFHETGTSEPDVENFINYMLQIENVIIGLLFTEFNDEIKISFRSKGNITINELAQKFGGNGHLNAAGARVFNRTLEKVIEEVIYYSKQYVS